MKVSRKALSAALMMGAAFVHLGAQQAAQSNGHTWTLVVHGGAGEIERAALGPDPSTNLETAAQRLRKKGSSPTAVIAGRITGAISVTERIEIAATAVIRGRVSARSIAMARGATIDGDIIVTSGEPVVQFEEKRGSEKKS